MSTYLAEALLRRDKATLDSHTDEWGACLTGVAFVGMRLLLIEAGI